MDGLMRSWLVHISLGSKKTSKWTTETLNTLAKNYDDVKVFRKEQPKAVASAKYFGVFNAITKYMKNHKIVWDFDNLKTEALNITQNGVS